MLIYVAVTSLFKTQKDILEPRRSHWLPAGVKSSIVDFYQDNRKFSCLPCMIGRNGHQSHLLLLNLKVARKLKSASIVFEFRIFTPFLVWAGRFSLNTLCLGLWMSSECWTCASWSARAGILCQGDGCDSLLFRTTACWMYTWDA